MAFKHFAFTFHSDLAHRHLYEQIVQGNVVHPKRLQKIAKEIMEHPPEEVLATLSAFRYDSSWLIDEDNDQSNTRFWYIIYLSTYFKKAPSLSDNRISNSHLILEKILPLAGWQSSEIRSLLFGEPVEKLLNMSGFSILANSLNLDSGCLGILSLKQLKSKLIETRDTFTIDNAIRNQISSLVGISDTDLTQLIEYAIEDGIQMLSATDKHGNTLHLFRD